MEKEGAPARRESDEEEDDDDDGGGDLVICDGPERNYAGERVGIEIGTGKEGKQPLGRVDGIGTERRRRRRSRSLEEAKEGKVRVAAAVGLSVGRARAGS